MNSTDIDFEYIVLNRSELRQLRKAARTGKSQLDKSHTLIKIGLMTEEKKFNSGYAPVSTGLAEITEMGNAYLRYINRRM